MDSHPQVSFTNPFCRLREQWWVVNFKHLKIINFVMIERAARLHNGDIYKRDRLMKWTVAECRGTKHVENDLFSGNECPVWWIWIVQWWPSIWDNWLHVWIENCRILFQFERRCFQLVDLFPSVIHNLPNHSGRHSLSFVSSRFSLSRNVGSEEHE